ncbi:hypothetical protein LJC04_05615 [Ruminococcaceae bacterium OttesenSCG-928-O06]|nr:hypothetical protein [Ruminococcaceae bacterium OttesenSCG-928-O06]
MDLDACALAAWEAEQSAKEVRRIYKTGKRQICPRREKLLDYRNNTTIRFYGNKEDRWIQKMTMRKYRRFLKRNLENEAYYTAQNRDYRTRGWLTW